MSYGLKVWDSSGDVTFDSTLAVGGCLMEIVSSSTSSSVVKTYPNFAGRSAFAVLTTWLRYSVIPTIDYALGYPRLTIPVTSADVKFAVFIA